MVVFGANVPRVEMVDLMAWRAVVRGLTAQ